ncbi:glycosyltransferase [Amylibacter sp.]|nr:glycosyltransferase [Amylibacter sp.]
MNSFKKPPLVSIVTITFNSEQSISRTLSSVASQTYRTIEHIIKDGRSTDGTENIVKKQKSGNTSYVSCSDTGIYDALNQALMMCKGEYVVFLHSDDVFKDSMTIEKLVSSLELSGADGIYGDVEFVTEEGRILRRWVSSKFKKWKLYCGWMPPHTSLMLRRQVYQDIGEFDTGFKIAGDYEFILRLFLSNNYNLIYENNVVTVMTIGGASTSGISSQIKKISEDWRAIRKHGLLNLFTLLTKRVLKLNQWIMNN